MFSEFIAQKLYEVNVIGKEEVELYQYCLNAFIEIMGFIIIVILHSIYMGEAMKGLIFLGIVIPMRSHGGGWHANTAKVCFGLSIIYYLTVVFVSERLPDTFDNLRFMALISAIIILLSPVDSINKPLDSEQRKIEKKKTCRYIVAIYSISLILKWNSLTCYVKEINFALFIVLCSMIFGIVSNTKSNRKQDV